MNQNEGRQTEIAGLCQRTSDRPLVQAAPAVGDGQRSTASDLSEFCRVVGVQFGVQGPDGIRME